MELAKPTTRIVERKRNVVRLGAAVLRRVWASIDVNRLESVSALRKRHQQRNRITRPSHGRGQSI